MLWSFDPSKKDVGCHLARRGRVGITAVKNKGLGVSLTPIIIPNGMTMDHLNERLE
jgi:hypothetical protein